MSKPNTYTGGDRFTVINPLIDEDILERIYELDELLVNWHGDMENTNSDVLAYLMHIVELSGDDWDRAEDRGRMHYECEREGVL
jgi:hypothetical protein